MADEANSWIRRTNFSHTVCHRLDSSALGSIPFAIAEARLRLRPFAVEKQASACGPGRRSTVVSKQRSLSPLPDTALSDTFREARTERKRFSTPLPQRKEPGKGAKGQSFHKDSRQRSLQISGTSLVRSSYSAKALDKVKGRKDGWTMYFDHGGGRVVAVDSADHWEVDMSKLFLGLRFAHGANSRLYHGIYKDEPVAVKIIRVPDDDESKTFASRLENQFTREITLLSRLYHRHVIKFVAASKKPPVYCIITEYLSEGSLRAYLHKLEDKLIPLQKLIAIALDVARGMEYVHSQGVVHRDLKPENILINQDFRLKIADFGIACEENSCDNLANDPGTYRWMAPEMIKRKSHGRKVDSYSFGLILWEMVAGTIPYEEMTPIQAAFAVVNKNLRPAMPKDCPPALQALIEQCWSVHPEKRPEFWQIVKVLEEFDSSLARDGTLSLAPQGSTCQDHKKGLRHWIQKLGQANHHSGSSILALKPKFSSIWSDAMHIGQLQKGSHDQKGCLRNKV